MPRSRVSVVSCSCLASCSLPGGNLFSHQPYFVDAYALSDIDDLSDFIEKQVRITVNEDHALVPCFENFCQLTAESADIDFLLVNLHDARFVFADNDGLVGLIGRRWWGSRRRRLRYGCIQSLRCDWCDRHEDDEEHQKNIYERSDVDVSLRTNLLTFLS